MPHKAKLSEKDRIQRISDLVQIAAGVTGTPLTDLQAFGFAEELLAYPLPDVEVALRTVRLSAGRLTLHKILEAMPGGHPGAEEAWALIAGTLGNEGATVVWTDEMREAYGVACALADDPIAARKAFLETYERAVVAARAARRKPAWSVSLGHDPAQREGPILAAVEAGRLPPDRLRQLLPAPVDTVAATRIAALVDGLARRRALPSNRP